MLAHGVLVVDAPAHREIELELWLPAEACETGSCEGGGAELVRELIDIDVNGSGTRSEWPPQDPATCVPDVEVHVNFDRSEALRTAPLIRKTKFVSGRVEVRVPLRCVAPNAETELVGMLVLARSFEGTRE